ncbi:MAG: GNAT family N-acetyltransferase, partial [Acidimicrobiales bacterium]
VDTLMAIRVEPSVAHWWGKVDPERALDEFFGDAAAFVIELDSEIVGCIQYGEEPDPNYRHASIDLFVRTDSQGQDLGPEALRTLARHLIDQRGHHRLTIDPATANERAVRAYARVGFRPVGIMRQYERGPDGTWHDGLLMDLLAGELT